MKYSKNIFKKTKYTPKITHTKSKNIHKITQRYHKTTFNKNQKNPVLWLDPNHPTLIPCYFQN